MNTKSIASLQNKTSVQPFFKLKYKQNGKQIHMFKLEFTEPHLAESNTCTREKWKLTSKKWPWSP